MDIKTLDSTLSATPQITVGDLPAIKAKGFKAIICNRPDGEGPDQPTYKDIEAAATKLGLDTAYLPIVPGNMRDADVDDFARLLAELPSPVLAYCRTGTRSATLWSLTQAGKQSVADILGKAKAAGYDLTALEPRISARCQ